MKEKVLQAFYLWLTVIEMVTLTVFSLIMVVKQYRAGAPTFFTFLCLILMFVDLDIIAMTVLYNLEDNFKGNRIMLASLIGIVNGVYYCGLWTVYWMYSFKYYVISQEVPKLIKGIPLDKYSEKWY
jgi:hypothetical protein